jgi:putative chitinase
MAITDGPKVLSQEHVRKIFEISDSKAGEWHPYIQQACDERQINTVFRLAAFLANVKVESGSLGTLAENLNYSSSRLLQVFPKYFKDKDTADQYAGKPQLIANRVYGSRMGNGSEDTGDGWAYRGRGCIQLTGKSNYEACTRAGVSCLGANSDYLLTKAGAIRSAAWFWDSKGLNRPADAADFDTVCRRINGGTQGLAERKTAYELALVVLSDLPDGTKVNTDPTDPGTGDDNQLEVQAKPPIDQVDPKHTTIQEPIAAGQAQYPWNQAHESRSGHVIEIDDTPSAERLHWYHRSGTYTEFQPDGTMVSKAIKDAYLFVNGNSFRDIKGDETTKTGGQSYEKIGSEKVIEAGSTITLKNDSQIQLDSPEVVAREHATIPIISCQMIKMRPGDKSSGAVADLKARDADHADHAACADWSLKAGGLGPGKYKPKTGSMLSGSWASLADYGAYDGSVDFTPISTTNGESSLGFSEDFTDLITEVVSDSETKIEGNDILTVNQDRVMKSGGDVLDHNLGEREIASGEELKIISDVKVTIKAPSIKLDGPVTSAPAKALMFTPIASTAELGAASAVPSGTVAVYIDNTGALKRAQSNGTTWTVLT